MFFLDKIGQLHRETDGCPNLTREHVETLGQPD